MNTAKTRWIILFFLIYICQTISAQNFQLKGTVKDSNTGELLIGVTVTDQTGHVTTLTDVNGSFSLQTQKGNNLRISYIGYISREIKIKDINRLEITLSPDMNTLEEVVVVGYGSQKKYSLSGSIGTVTQEVFADRPTPNAVTALQGQIPGLNITKTQGKPGAEDWMINIRGLSSNRDLSPLIVIDGLPVASSEELMRINANDIENVSVLKDASASIYGSRAAGGVIMVTTKQAREGKSQIAYNGSVTLETLGRNIRLMDRKEWFNNLDDAYNNADLGNSHPFFLLKEFYMGDKSNYSIPRNDPRFEGMASFQDVKDFTFCDTDWQDVFFGSAVSTQHNLSMSGSSARTRYYVSLGYSRQNSPLKWGDLNDRRYSGRVNLDVDILKNLTSKTKISYEQEHFIQPTATDDAVGTLMQRQPGMASQTIDGKPYAWGAQPAMNWAMELGGDNKRNFSRINLSESLEYKLFNDLTITGVMGFNKWVFRDSKLTQPVTYYDYTGTQVVLETPKKVDTQFESSWDTHFYQSYQLYANYKHTFARAHNINVMVGTSYETDFFDRSWNSRKELSVNDLPSLNIGNPDLSSNGDERTQWGIASYFGRFNYGYKDRYLLEGNFRYDGSSRFTAANRWGLFGGISGAWRISEEDFVKAAGIFQNLKVRASYGTAGNQEGIGLYDYIQRISMGTYPFGKDQYKAQIAGMNGMVSLERTWETVKTFNAGLDIAVLDNRLSASFDYFKKRNDDMLISVSYPGLLGATAPATNNGEMETKGYELSLTWRDKTESLSYFITATFSDSRNKMLYLGGEGEIRAWNIAYKQGHSANSFYGYKSDGIIQNETQLSEYKKRFNNLPSNIDVGDAMFIDKNNDGKLTYEGDLYDLGSADPRYGFSLNLGMEYKGFDLSAFFQGYGQIFGYNWNNRPYDNWWLNNNSYFVGKTARLTEDPNDPGRKIVANPDAPYPKASAIGSISGYNYGLSDIMLSNYGYIRLKNITLGYTIPRKWTQKAGISQLRLYFTGQDVWEWVKTDDGWDPERNWRNMTSSYFPSMRSWSFGINLVF